MQLNLAVPPWTIGVVDQLTKRLLTQTSQPRESHDGWSDYAEVSMAAVEVSDDHPPGILASIPMALAAWTRRQWITALGASMGLGLAMGLSTVLIPNRVFGRQVPSLAWNYPVWVIVSILSGMIAATYIDVEGATSREAPEDRFVDADSTITVEARSEGARSAKFGSAGAILGWFAVGCPVCNKIALIALGYSGAMQWFAPAQPFLAAVAIALSATALAMRLRGQILCPLPNL